MSRIKVDDIRSRQNSTHDSISLASDSSVSLKHSGSAKLTTSSTGVSITGACAATSFSGDGSALTGVGGGGYEFVKKIQPSGVTTVTEHGLDYDSVYKLVFPYVNGQSNMYLRFYPHLDNSTTSFTPADSNNVCKHRLINTSGVSSEITNTDHWGFGTGNSSYEFGGSIDFWTGYRCWIIGNTRALYNDAFCQLYGRLGHRSNTNNDSNQTGTYAKMNGFTLDLNGWNFLNGTEILLYKNKVS